MRWTAREEAIAATELLEAARALLGETPEPDSPTARRALLQGRLAAGHPHGGAYERRRETIVGQFTPLVRSIAASLATEASAIFGELVSDGQVALIDAVDSWRPRAGVRFMSFAYPVVRHRMLSRLRKAARSRLLVESLEQEPSSDESNPELLIESGQEAAERLVWLRDQLRRLSMRQRQVVHLLYHEARTPDEAAASMRITRQAVCRLHGRAVKRMRVGT